MDRLQKIISAAGVCSRRQAEEFLRSGRVSVNGRPASLGDQADPETDRITLDGRPLALPSEKLYIMLHKPRGVVTTLSDEKGRPTVAGLVSGCGGRAYPVGRLDMDSEGLLLLTSDGAFAQRLAHPAMGWRRSTMSPSPATWRAVGTAWRPLRPWRTVRLSLPPGFPLWRHGGAG